MTKIREYAEEMPVKIIEIIPEDIYSNDWIYERILNENRLVIKATNEGGCNCTLVDLIDVIKWVKENKPELLEDIE